MPVDPTIAKGFPAIGREVMPAYYAAEENQRRNAYTASQGQLMQQQIESSKAAAQYNAMNANANMADTQLKMRREQTIAQMTEALGIAPEDVQSQQAWEQKWGVPAGATAGKWAQTQQVAAASLNPEAAAKERISPTQPKTPKTIWAVRTPGAAPERMTEDEAMQVGAQPPPANAAPQKDTYTWALGPDGKPVRMTNADAVATGAQQAPQPSAQMSPAVRSKINDKIQAASLITKQLDAVQARYDKIKDTYSAGPSWSGQGIAATPEGKAFDASLDPLRTLIRTLTRTPGEGSMSDWEGRLAQSIIPDRGQYEEVTQQQINQLRDLISGINSGYSAMLNPNAGGPTVAPPTGGGELPDPLGIRK